LIPGIGYRQADGTIIQHLDFADEVVLLSRTKQGMVQQAAAYEQALGLGGLLLNAEKSATLNINVDEHNKTWVVDPLPFLHLNGKEVPALNCTSYYKYLGVQVRGTT
jgi:hypothetical protein